MPVPLFPAQTARHLNSFDTVADSTGFGAGARAGLGVVHETDEGAAAHIWQLLMAGQLPFAAYFVIRRLPKHTSESLQILVLLAATWLANFAAVYLLTQSLIYDNGGNNASSPRQMLSRQAV